MKTLQEYLKENSAKNLNEHRLVAHVDEYGRTSFYIHVLGSNSDTLDFCVEDNSLLDDANPKAGINPGASTTIPGTAELHKIITRECRARKAQAALHDVVQEVNESLSALDEGWDQDSDVKFHVLVTVDRP